MSSYDPIEEYIEQRELNFKLELIGAFFEALDPRSKAIVRARYCLNNRLTYEALGLLYGISRYRVRQIEVNAIRKIRRYVCEILKTSGCDSGYNV